MSRLGEGTGEGSLGPTCIDDLLCKCEQLVDESMRNVSCFATTTADSRSVVLPIALGSNKTPPFSLCGGEKGGGEDEDDEDDEDESGEKGSASLSPDILLRSGLTREEVPARRLEFC